MSILAVIGINKKNGLNSKHFGDSEKFRFYKISEGNAELYNEILNSNKDIDETSLHGSENKKKSILELIGKDIDVIISGEKSPNFIKINKETKILPIISEIFDEEKIVSYLIQNHSKILDILEKKKQNIFMDIQFIKEK